MNSTREVWLVTGGSGCIGAWTVLTLVREGVTVVALDRETGGHRQRLIASEDELARITAVQGDITDLAGLERVLAEYEVTHVVHLAGLQAPFCKADPPLGAQVNVTGTTNVLEAVRRHGLTTPVSYASSSGVYDAAGESSRRRRPTASTRSRTRAAPASTGMTIRWRVSVCARSSRTAPGATRA
jgi:nucleoside-diphosphate-sugar epimerase